MYLSPDDEQQLINVNRFNKRRDPPDDQDDENMNIIQAIKNSSRVVRDEHAPMDKRAVHLCWLLHLGLRSRFGCGGHDRYLLCRSQTGSA